MTDVRRARLAMRRHRGPASLARVIALVGSLAVATPDARGQKTAVRTDSVLLARDLDGGGKKDYVVRESKPGSHGLRYRRVAVYVDAAPQSRAASWATEWNDEGGEVWLSQSAALASGLWLLELDAAEADYYPAWVLLVDRGRVREEITHGVDYGDGYLVVRRGPDSVIVEATLPHLQLRGTPVTPDLITCKEAEWSALQLLFDAKQRRFTPVHALCVNRR